MISNLDCKDGHVHSGLLPLLGRHNYKTKAKRDPKIKFLPYFVIIMRMNIWNASYLWNF